MKKILIILALMFAVTAYAQSPWSRRIRSPVDVSGLADRVTALEVENVVLRAALLAQLYDKQLQLAANLRSSTEQALDENGQPTGWGVHIYDPGSPNGKKWIIGTDHIDLVNIQISDNDLHIAALEALNQ